MENEVTRFTPGPWHTGGSAGLVVYDADGYDVGDAITFHGKHEDAMANANLIAAAPDLYEALWIATEHNALYYGESHNTVIGGRAALAAARGER